MNSLVTTLVERMDWRSMDLEQVLKLHRGASKYLGFLPKGAFEEAAKDGRIIVAKDSRGTCLGYLLFRISRRRVSVTHLCVHPDTRKRGIAKLLIDKLKADSRDHPGVGLYCRADWPASGLWQKLGFKAVNAKEGRGKDNARLTFWWFDNGHPDLFSGLNQPSVARIPVIIDANVFIDLLEESESSALLADWVQAVVELVTTKELATEINRAASHEERTKALSELRTFKTLPVNEVLFEKALVELSSIFPGCLSRQDESDKRQVAYAIAGGANYMVTRDLLLIDRCDPLFKSHGLRVLQPAGLITHIDSIERVEQYRPYKLGETQIRAGRVKGEHVDSIVAALKRDDERAHELRSALLGLLESPKETEVHCVRERGGAEIVLYALDLRRQGILRVPLIRAAKHSLASTLTRHLVKTWISCAAIKGRSVLLISDVGLSVSDRALLNELGFTLDSLLWFRLVIRTVGSVQDLGRSLKSLPLDQDYDLLRSNILGALEEFGLGSIKVGHEVIERVLWPAKVVPSSLKSYIVPIRPIWAQNFFELGDGSQGSLWVRDELQLGIEGVYYRKGMNGNVSAPGRVLWYVSAGKDAGPKAILACSSVDEVVVGRPKDLFKRFEHLGVYEWRDVFKAAGNNHDVSLTAFRFRMTEQFVRPVSIGRLEELGIRGPIMSPRRVPEDQFNAIYKEGVGLV